MEKRKVRSHREKKEESDAYDEDCGNNGNAVISAACGNIDET
jgi:hypothetical protein